MQNPLEKHVTEAVGKANPGAAIDFAIIMQIMQMLMGFMGNCPFGGARRAIKAGGTDATIAAFTAVKKSGYTGNAVDLARELVERGKAAADDEIEEVLQSAASMPMLSRLLMVAVMVFGMSASVMAGPFPEASGPFPIAAVSVDDTPPIAPPSAAPAAELWFYTQASCPACSVMDPIVARLESGGVKVHRVDCTLRDYGNVSSTPLFRFSRDGHTSAPDIVGATTETQLLASLSLDERLAVAAGRTVPTPAPDAVPHTSPAGYPVSGGVAAAQAPTPHSEVARILELLKPRADETFVDYGCGDGRFLIAAVEQYGCRAVGVEIDPQQVAKARARVEYAGLSDRIEIIEGDARTIDVDADVGSVYLYPELLAQLRPKLQKLDRFASYMHPVPGLSWQREDGDAYVWSSKSERAYATQATVTRQTVAPRPTYQAMPQQRTAVWNNQTYSQNYSPCGNRNCGMCYGQGGILRQLGL